ncbi:MAG: hypothetical protein FWD63_03455 [Propionibacteriaceae bacterium]|nr:hypothetical protein [Propionibacteriaceae bacterium]
MTTSASEPHDESTHDQPVWPVLDDRPDLVERLHTDPSAYLELVKLAVADDNKTSGLVTAAVASARHAGCTWEQIGENLGVSAQDAQTQYGGPQPAASRPSDSMILAPVTAFNEMSVLDRAGKFGWHASAYGIMFFTVVRDTQQWEHARTVLTALPESEGWRPVGGGWMWWRYWARPLNVPVLPGDPTAADLIANHLPA